MSDSIATWMTPDSEVKQLIELGQWAAGIKLWRKQDHRLLDGQKIVPSLATCVAMVQGVKMGLGDIPLTVEKYHFWPREE